MKCSNRQLMASFASTVLLTLLLSSSIAAQQQGQDGGPPQGLGDRVAREIAALWDTSAEQLRLEWGIVRQRTSLPDSAAFRLVGEGTDGWFVVVFERDGRSPVAARLRVASVGGVPVASRRLTAGATLVDGDVVYAERSSWGPPGRHAAATPTAGWRVRRSVSAGEELVGLKIAPPLLVRAGEMVRLVWSRGGVSVVVEGLAVNAAALGEEVRARFADRPGKARGIVTGPGTADLVGSITR